MQSKNEVSKMSLAASKAWITRKLNAAKSSLKNEGNNEKKASKKLVKKSMSMKADEKKAVMNAGKVSGRAEAIKAVLKEAGNEKKLEMKSLNLKKAVMVGE